MYSCMRACVRSMTIWSRILIQAHLGNLRLLAGNLDALIADLPKLDEGGRYIVSYAVTVAEFLIPLLLLPLLL